MSESPILEYWPEGIAAARIPANNNVRLLQALLLNPAISATTAAQPGSPAEGDVYILPASPTGANWAAFFEDDVVIYYNATWTAYTPPQGLLKYVEDEDQEWQFVGSSSGGWSAFGGGGGGTVSSVNGDTGAVVINVFQNIQLSDMTTDITTGTAKAAWFAPEAGDLVSVYIGLHDPSSSGDVRIDMNDSGGSVFTTRPLIQATEATSITGTPAVLDGTVSFVRGDKFTFDIDDAGTDAKGLQVVVEYAPT